MKVTSPRLDSSQGGDKMLRRGYRSHATRHDAEGATNGADALPQEAMPNHVRTTGPPSASEKCKIV
jgi:hypothetical protein